MLVELKAEVMARREDGTFVTLKAGTKINYSCSKRDGKWVHQFTAFDPKNSHKILTYIEVGPDRPNWL